MSSSLPKRRPTRELKSQGSDSPHSARAPRPSKSKVRVAATSKAVIAAAKANARREIGLTGGICCGKTTLARGLEDRGWHIIDTDVIAHRLMQPGADLWKKVVDVFGPNILCSDQSIDRKVLGRIVFSDPNQRIKLNEITHPAIRTVWQEERDERVRSHPSQSLAIVIPLLFECQLETMFTAVWSVGASRTVQISRLKHRGLSHQEAEQRIASQWSIAEKMSRSQIAFWGEGTPASLLRQLSHVLP